MGKRIFLTMFAALAASGFIVMCTLGDGNRQRRSENRIAAAEKAPDEPLYTIREFGGKIAVFRRGSDQPLMYADADPLLLPESDRSQLREGISFDSESQLKAYIQDLTC